MWYNKPLCKNDKFLCSGYYFCFGLFLENHDKFHDKYDIEMEEL